ncbi:hypothetical protein [Thermaurantimonas aggregans]|uniref:hypothetical protein n=1 Tax=Thermaurantimonas aggregans TaxID=2173829 RepID=UPI0023EFF2CB|nr:hypothetical protein [Thermaurantimonas aggregans]MCX8148466.1 hypothetical protein [Thermaurantimonas aggregans]
MKHNSTRKADYELLTIQSIESPTDLHNGLDEVLNKHLDRHYIIDITKLSLKESHAKELQKLLDKYRSSSRSIIYITKIEDLSLFDERAPVVPTLQEAIDFLEMEEIERKLTGEEE